MKITTIIVHAVVLWAVVQTRHVRRMERSLPIEDKGRNLTEKLQQEEIHSDVLQHFTLAHTSTQTTPSAFFRADPLVLEDSNVQNLKNDDNVRVLYDGKVTIDKESPSSDSDENNKTLKAKSNDVISTKYNQTGPSSNKISDKQISHSSLEHSTSLIFDEEDRDQKEKEEPHTQMEEHHPKVSFTEPLKEDLEWKNVETKKKEKGKKEILEVATVPIDHFKLEKPLKDNVIGVKLKEKNKDSITEALDEQRSTIRISNSSSVSLSENDNNNTLGSLDIFKADSSIVNNEESAGQSVNSVINSNGVNSESSKRSRIKYSAAKRAHDIANDTEAENSSASENQLIEEAARNTVPVLLNIEPQTTPSMLTGTTISDKVINHKHIPLYQRPKPTDSTPTKIDIFEKLASPSPTTLVKPSIAFKQQLASKLKSLDPAPTDVTVELGDPVEDNLEKISGKLPTKPSLKKKSKPDYYAQPSEIHIPPTATSWTLVSMKAATDDLRTARKPAVPHDGAPSPSDTTVNITTVKQTTVNPITRVKSFVPWSTRLLKSSSMKPPTTPLTEDISETPATQSDYKANPTNISKQNLGRLSLENVTLHSTTEEQTVIRTTEELNRNITETSINLVQSSLNDIMIRDQSSTKSNNNIKTTEGPTTELVITTSSSPQIENTADNYSKIGLNTQGAEKENIIETKQISEDKEVRKDTDKNNDKIEKETHNLENINKNITLNNEVSSSDPSDNIEEGKSPYINESSNFVLTFSSTTSTPESIDSSKIKNTNEFSDLDSVLSDILGEAGDESKSMEEEEEDEKPKLTTTLPPIFDPFETTLMSDLDEEDEVDEKYDEELAIPIDKPTHNLSKSETTTIFNATDSTTETTVISNITDPIIEMINPNTTQIVTEMATISDTANLTTEYPVKPNTDLFPPTEPSIIDTKMNLTTDFEWSSTTQNIPMAEINSSSSYVTSFDIVSKGNTTQVVTNMPAEGDINWYSVDTRPVSTPTEEVTIKASPDVTTMTAPMETTNEPELATEKSQQEVTILPETTVTVISSSTSTTTETTEIPTIPDEKEVVEVKEEEFEEGEVDPRACVMVRVSSWKLCHDQQQLRESIASQFMSDVSWEQVMFFSRKLQDCSVHEQQSREEQALSIEVCFFDKQHEPSPFLKEEFLRIKDSSFSIMTPAPEGFDNVFAAIVLSVIAAICLVLLGILLVIVRKRQGRFNYGQRCTPVSLDDYSLDNISVYNSVRRKGLRASKRSYGNPAFDDPGGPTHSINFAGLANFSNDRVALDEEFSQIPMITVKPDELPPGAESKNRYANVIPLPETRVPLQTKEGSELLDEYINANYIKGPKGQEKLYIACQAPLQSTVEDFWRMVWQQQTKVILMLTALTENGVEKCADYLPQLEITDCHRLFGDFQVTLKKHEVREKYIISTLQLKNLETNLWREVTHLWYSSWPAQGVPEEGNSLIAFLIEARSYARGATGPTVVHCSPGTGRTGTVIAIDLCIRDFETLRSVDIPRTVYALRRDRAGSVQTKDQYAFIYQVLNLYATKLTGGGMDSI